MMMMVMMMVMMMIMMMMMMTMMHEQLIELIGCAYVCLSRSLSRIFVSLFVFVCKRNESDDTEEVPKLFEVPASGEEQALPVLRELLQAERFALWKSWGGSAWQCWQSAGQPQQLWKYDDRCPQETCRTPVWTAQVC